MLINNTGHVDGQSAMFLCGWCKFVSLSDRSAPISGHSDMVRKNQEEDEIRFEKKLKLITDCYESQPSMRARLDDDEDNDGGNLSDKALSGDGDECVSSVLLHREKRKVKVGG